MYDERSDVVFVAVRQDDRGQIVAIFFEKIEIRDRNIDAVRRFLGKSHAGVDDDHLIAVADAHAVHPELADAAERNYFDLFHLISPASSEFCSIAYAHFLGVRGVKSRFDGCKISRTRRKSFRRLLPRARGSTYVRCQTKFGFAPHEQN